MGIYALIFLFKYVDTSASAAASDPAIVGTSREVVGAERYFAHQVINNACATMALLNAVMNLDDGTTTSASSSANVKLGKELEELKSFSLALDPGSRGWAVSNSEKIREVHNSFARSDPFEHMRDPDDEREKEDAYHFIAYVPIRTSPDTVELFELDGLKPAPVSHGVVGASESGDSSSSSAWTDRAKEVIEGRIASYGGSEINFNLMAICADQVETIQRRIEACHATQSSAAGGDTGTGLAGDVQAELIDLQSRLQEELAKRERWAFDNTLRRHNHLGLVHALLVAMAKEGKLQEAVEDSTKVMKERQDKARERAKMAGQA